MIEMKNISLSYSAIDLFEGVNLSIWQGTVGWLVWNNWSWKTTLLKIIAWKLKPDSGFIDYKNKNPKIWYMRQEIPAEEISLVSDYISREISSSTYIQENELGKSNLIVDEIQYFWFENDFGEILSWLWETTEILKRNLNTLSWWQKNKILIALAIYQWNDILLLDEPTNNLDAKSISWLKKFLRNSNATILIISHDRDFLDEITNMTYEIDQNDHKIIEYKGNYSEYKKYKDELYKKELNEYEVAQDKANKLRAAEAEARMRMDKACRSKPKDNDKYQTYFFQERATMSHWTKARFLSKRISALEDVTKPLNKKKIKYSIDNSEIKWRIYWKWLQCKYDETWFKLEIPSFEATPKDRIGIFWDNWSWKTSFLNALRWKISFENWDLLISKCLKIWDFLQEHENLDKNKTPIEVMTDIWNINELEANRLLSIFDLKYSYRRVKIWLLSPGQRARLILSLFRAVDYNLLLLDEPTNHLDMEAMEVLEEALEWFEGIVVVVSHDKRFIKWLNLNKRYKIDNSIMLESLD